MQINYRAALHSLLQEYAMLEEACRNTMCSQSTKDEASTRQQEIEETIWDRRREDIK